MRGTTTTQRGVLSALLAVALLAGLVAVITTGSAAPAAASGHTVSGLVPAPVRELPICQTIPDPDIGGCLIESDLLTVTVSGSMDASGSTTVRMVPAVPPCESYDPGADVWSPSPCYSGAEVGLLTCKWLEDSTGDLKECPELYQGKLGGPGTFIETRGTYTYDGELREDLACDAAGNFVIYAFGGPANVPGGRWSERGPQALVCELTLDGPAFDNLMGASWLFVNTGLTIEESGVPGILGRWEPAQGYVEINGFLGPDAPDPGPEDPVDDDAFELVGPFADIPASSFARADILLLLDLGITTGTSDTTFSPAALVTREQMAAFLGRLWRALGNTCPDASSPFSDVGSTSFAGADVACIFALGITTGVTERSYDPGGLVTREQMAAFLARMWRALGNDCPPGSTGFTDVSPSSFAGDDIACIFQLGITTGTSATTYAPNAIVTREQMAAFLARTHRLADAKA